MSTTSIMQTATEKRYLMDEEQMKKPICGKDAKTELYGCDLIQEESSIGILSSGSSVGLEGLEKHMHMLKPCSNGTRILCLSHAVTDEDFECDENYQDLKEDLTSGGLIFGKLVKVVIPRPSPDHDRTPGVGRAFLEYADLESASRARSGMNGKSFADDEHKVLAVYYPENKYAHGDFDG